MQKLFEFDEHIGDWRVLVQSKDIANGVIKSRHIADDAVTGDKIATETIEGRNIAPDAVDGTKIKNNTVTGRNIAKEAIQSRHLEDESITGDEVEHDAVIPGKIANDAVQTRNIKDRNVTGRKIAKEAILPEHFGAHTFETLAADLQNQIDALDLHGVAVSNTFGADSHIGISQAALTDAWNNVYHLLEEALGRTLLGFTWVVTPTYIYGEWPTTVHITAIPTNPEDKFEYIKLSVNGETIDEVTDKVSTYAFDTDLQTSVNIRMDAQVLGKPYYREETINHYDSFWMGAGATYADIMNETHNINFSQGTRLAKDVTVADGEHIIIMMGESWVPAFIRADMNGVEIEFDETTVTIDGKNYKVLTSKSVFEAGTYNIDING